MRAPAPGHSCAAATTAPPRLATARRTRSPTHLQVGVEYVVGAGGGRAVQQHPGGQALAALEHHAIVGQLGHVACGQWAMGNVGGGPHLATAHENQDYTKRKSNVRAGEFAGPGAWSSRTECGGMADVVTARGRRLPCLPLPSPLTRRIDVSFSTPTQLSGSALACGAVHNHDRQCKPALPCRVAPTPATFHLDNNESPSLLL